MKKYAPLLVLLIISFSTFSQSGTLRPIVHIQDNDTLFCFYINQTKDIAKRIAAGESCADEVAQYKHIVTVLDSMVLVKNRQIDLLKKESTNNALIFNEQKNMVDGYKSDADTCGKKLKRQKILTKICFGLMLVFGGVAVVK